MQSGTSASATTAAAAGSVAVTATPARSAARCRPFAFLSDGKVNLEAFRDVSARAMYEQAIKTQALAQLYYGKRQKYAYYDGHSQGGRQGMKVAQERPELYDGYLIAQPALSVPQFGLSGFWTQVVMKSELGINALNKPAAAAFAKKVDAATARAVKSCDKEGLGFLLDPFSCSYDPVRDSAGLCTAAGGSNADAATCLSAKEALALAKIWNGPTRDGSYDANASVAARSGKTQAPQQLWWTVTRGSSLGGQINSAGTDFIALTMQDVSYSADGSATSSIPPANASTTRRNRWAEMGYAAYADTYAKAATLPFLRDYATDNTDLAKLRDQGRKILLWNGLAEDVIPPQGAVRYYEQVAARLGGEAQVQKFFRMYNIPGMAHSSQGRAWTVGNVNNTVPMPKLPGNANQNPTRDQDTMFCSLVDWVERCTAPNDIVLASRDNATSYPVCVYPKKISWNGTGPARQAASYSCR